MSLSTLALDAGWRDHTAQWNPLVEPRFAPIDGSACHAPRLLVAPDLPGMLIPESGKISYNFFVPAGSIIWGLWCQPQAVEVAGEEEAGADDGDAQVTDPPVLIDAATEDSGQFTFRNPYYQGPFLVGSDLYCVLRTTVGTPRAVKVFKSTDAGVTWTQQDTANSPVFVDGGGFCRYQVRLNPDGTTLTIAYNAALTNAANTLKWVTFDTLTDTFTSGVIPDLTDGGVGNVTGLRSNFDFVIRLNGDILITYNKIVAPNITQNSLGFRVMSGGVWGAFTVTAAGDDGTGDTYGISALCLDEATGVTHVFVDKGSVILLQAFLNVCYQQISALDVATAVAQVTPDVVDYRPSYGRPCIFGDRVCLPIYNVTVIAGPAVDQFTAQAIIGTPLAAPVFTITDLDAGDTQLLDAECTQFVVEDGSLVAMWVYWPDSSTILLRRADFDGVSWSTPETFYDLIANPPSSPVPADQGIFGFTMAVVGSIGVVFSALDPTDTFLLSYFIVGGAAPEPAALGIAIQITDLSLSHKFFQEPVDPRLLAVEGSDTDRFPSWFLLPTPHPVVGNGLFTLDVWGPPGKLYWVVFGIAEVKDCNA